MTATLNELQTNKYNTRRGFTAPNSIGLRGLWYPLLCVSIYIRAMLRVVFLATVSCRNPTETFFRSDCSTRGVVRLAAKDSLPVRYCAMNRGFYSYNQATTTIFHMLSPHSLLKDHCSWQNHTYRKPRISLSSGLVTSRSLKKSGITALMVKYISSFRFVFSKENLHPRRKVVMRWSSVSCKEKYISRAVPLPTDLF